MNRKVELYLKEFNETMTECTKFCFMSRGKEFQQEGVKKLTTLKHKAVGLKEQMIELKDEDSANTLLSLENLIDAVNNELEMWIALKEDNPDEAWNSLINSQGAVRTALQAHNIALGLNAEGYADKLYLLEKLLFPPQIFSSPSFIIESAQCSICEKEYGTCEHVVGKAYMGKICYKIITKIKEIKEISLVKEPANKLARMFQFTEKGITRDIMTWRTIEKK